MKLKNIAKVLGAVVGVVMITSASAQTLPERTKSGNEVHFLMHKNMLADQININKEILMVDSLTTLYRLGVQKEENLALDIYDDFDTDVVFRGLSGNLPDSLKINLVNYTPPAMGRITSKYGWRGRRMHKGIDIKVQIGDTIRSAFDGKVRVRKFERRGYGYYLVVRHPNGIETVYGHLSKFLVNIEENVKAGQPIALGGNTGRSTGSHLHFETRLMGIALNPGDLFDFDNGVAHTDSYQFVSKTAKAIANGDMGPGGVKYHTVRSGDNLGKIAKRYNISIDRLCRLNNMSKSKTLRIGQRLRYS